MDFIVDSGTVRNLLAAQCNVRNNRNNRRDMKKLITIMMLLVVLTGCKREDPQPNQIRFAKVNNLPIIEAEINGKKARLLVDTGASQSLLDLTSQKRYEFEAYELKDEFHGIGGQTTIFSVHRAVVKYRDSTLNANFHAADLSHLRKTYGIIGIVGSDWLRRQRANINYNTNLITLSP